MRTFRLLFRATCAVALLSLAACGKQRVVLVEPRENDLIEINGCVISAVNYLAITKAKHRLEPDYWAKILLVRYENHAAGHAYCVWETDGTIYGYDRNSGGFPIPVYTKDPRAIAIVLAQELGKVLGEPLSVKSAGFVEPATAEIYAYSISETAAVPAPKTAPASGQSPAAGALLSSAPFATRPLSIELPDPGGAVLGL
jgi:hypothetical protein